MLYVFLNIFYWLCYSSCPISTPLFPSALHTPSHLHPPPRSSCPWVYTHKLFGFYISILFLPSHLWVNKQKMFRSIVGLCKQSSEVCDFSFAPETLSSGFQRKFCGSLTLSCAVSIHTRTPRSFTNTPVALDLWPRRLTFSPIIWRTSEYLFLTTAMGKWEEERKKCLSRCPRHCLLRCHWLKYNHEHFQRLCGPIGVK